MSNHLSPRILSWILMILTFLVVLSILAVGLTTRWGFAIPTEENTMNEQPTVTPVDPYLILANKDNPLQATYVPEPLTALPVDLTLDEKDISLESTAAAAAVTLLRDLHTQGYADIRITSGYRSYDYQQRVFNYNINVKEKENHPELSREEREAIVLTYSARPGQSEHQTGLCMDIISVDHKKLDETFAQNPVYEYLLVHAHEYGFILRYPEGKESITKYTYEPWHYRYVGVEVATAIHESGLTLEEYLDEVVPTESATAAPTTRPASPIESIPVEQD